MELVTIAIFLTTTICTLLGFVGVMFVFWVNIKTKSRYDVKIKETQETKRIARYFNSLVALTVSMAIFSFVIIFNYTTNLEASQLSEALLTILALLFMVWIVLMSLFFISIYDDFVEKAGFKQDMKKKK